MPDNMSDLKQHCLKSCHSILENIPISEHTNYSCIANALAKESTRFAILIGSSIVMLYLDYTNEDVSKMVNNMIEYGKGLQNELRKLASIAMNSLNKSNCSEYNFSKCDSTNSNCYKSIVDKCIVCFAEFHDDFNACNSKNTKNSIICIIYLLCLQRAEQAQENS